MADQQKQGRPSQEDAELRQYFDRRLSAMEAERLSFLPHWQDIADHIEPRSARINNTTDSNKGGKVNNKILNNTATLSLRTLKSGLMAGLTSPARPWFRLTPADAELRKNGAVNDWYHTVETNMREVFNRSNLYQVLPMCYGGLGEFGVGAFLVDEDDESVVRFEYLQTGTFLIATSKKGKPNSFARKYSMTARQLIEKFGEENCSDNVRALNRATQTETMVEVVHFIEPNPDRKRGSLLAKHKPFRSVYYESTQTGGMFLRQSGYDEFPVMAPRWDVFSFSDAYGYAPAMDALGDVKQLQLLEKRKLQAIDKNTNPPLLGDASLKTARISTIPGDITYQDNLASQQHAGLRPIYEVKFPTDELRQLKMELEARIKRCFFEDLMQMLAQSDNPEMTAREIEERHAEKVLILGPVMERLNDELFDPLIDRVFGIMSRRGMIPPPPQEIQGQQLKVEYTSIMAQAQKLIGTANIEKVAAFITGLAGVYPNALDKMDSDEMIDAYAEMYGIPPKLVRAADEVAKMRAAKQKMRESQQMAQMAKPMKDAAQGAQALGDTNVEQIQQIASMMGAA